MTKLLPFTRSSSIPHSNWQSAIQKAIYTLAQKEDSSVEYNDTIVKFHPIMLGANLHVDAHEKNSDIAALNMATIKSMTASDVDKDPIIQASLSQEIFLKAYNEIYNNDVDISAKTIDEIKEEISLLNLGFPYSNYTIECWARAVWNYYKNHGFWGKTGHQQYNDWCTTGSKDINYGLIEYELPPNAKVVIIGDYGTGLPDAVGMLESIMTTLAPDCIIHIGDVYYSGAEEECKTEILDLFLNVFKKVGKSVPLFSLPGNHEYMSGGQGFYKHVLDVNRISDQPVSTYQEASYFCLRSGDQKWQFLGMDTGFNSLPSPMPTIGPKLQESEVLWHKDKLDHFDGKTILLSHHQLYSVNSKINNKDGSPYLNDHLYELFSPYFQSISAWFWGHEHSLGIFEEGVHGLAKGRLVGNSGFEEALEEDSYKVNNPDPNVNYKSPVIKVESTPVTWNDQSHQWYNHGCAMINFTNVDQPEVRYYQFPVWVNMDAAPTNPQLTEIIEARETL